ncbi:hypothetical protein ABPG75_000847 [Micractinium tetrahymenae]
MSSLDELKARLRRLEQQRSGIEGEIALRSARLEAAGVGMQAPLVDAEGFPRADVDVAAIRADRHAIITLTNDFKACSRQMEQLLHALHAQSRSGQAGGAASGTAAVAAPAPSAAARPAAPAAAAPPTRQANGSSLQQPAAALSPAAAAAAASGPFAIIDELTDGSPAAEAGLQLNDQLCSVGGVTRHTPNTLQSVAALVQASEGQPVEAVVLRHGSPMVLTLTPKRGAGPGLLGCHLRPL